MRRSGLMFLCLCVCSFNAMGASIYVSAEDGDDHYNGSSSVITGDDGPKATIGEALSEAENGDTIVLLPGVYNESVFVSDMSITFTSIDPDDKEKVAKTRLMGISGNPAISVSDDGSHYCSVIGMTFCGSDSSGNGGAINSVSSNLAVERCCFKNNMANVGGAAYMTGSTAVFNCCYFSGNSALTRGGALEAASGVVELENCVFNDNSAVFGGGVTVLNAACVVKNCTIVNNEAEDTGGAITAVSNSTLIVYNSIFDGNTALNGSNVALRASGGTFYCNHIAKGPDYIDADDDSAVYHELSTSFNVAFNNSVAGDFRLMSGSGGLDAGENYSYLDQLATDIDGQPRNAHAYGAVDPAVVDLGAYEYQYGGVYLQLLDADHGVCYAPYVVNATVDQQDVSLIVSLAKPCSSDDMVIEVESESSIINIVDQMFIMTGCYSDIELSFGIEGLPAGEYKEEIVVKTDGAINGYLEIPVYLYIAQDPTSKTVPNEFASIQQAIDMAVDGDIITVLPGTYYEHIDFKGKDITVTGTAPGEIMGTLSTTIDGSAGTGPVVCFGSEETRSAVLAGFTIQNGSGKGFLDPDYYYGLGIYCYMSSPVIRNNIIRDNYHYDDSYETHSYGGGISSISGSPEIYGNIVYNNTATYGGGILLSSDASCYSNIIFANDADVAGGVVLEGGELTNNTIDSNRAYEEVGNLYLASYYRYDVKVCNNIISNSVGGCGVAVLSDDYNTVEFWNNNVWNNFINYYDYIDLTGIKGNISVDPMYVNCNAGNYHLMEGSPCISVGKNVEYLGSVDYDGEPRVYAAKVDIGSDEFVGDIGPVAVVMDDQIYAEVNYEVILDGSGSYFPEDSAEMLYHWEELAGPAVELHNSEMAAAGFVAIERGEYVFELTVSDGAGNADSDQVLVVIGNRVPVAVVGNNLSCLAGDRVYLNGNDSYDADGDDIVSWSWVKTAGPVTALHNANTANAWFDCVTEGEYEFELIVSDGKDTSLPAKVNVKTVQLHTEFTAMNKLSYATTDYFHYPEYYKNWIAYGVGWACDFTWDLKCRDLTTGQVFSITGEPGSSDVQPKIDGNVVVWFGTGSRWGHEPSNSCVFAYDLESKEMYTLRQYSWTESYSHPSISGDKVVWIEHLGIDPRPTGSSEALNWYDTEYNICGADISDLANPEYFTIMENAGRRDPYPCYTYSSDFDDVIDIDGDIVVFEAHGDIYGADISDLENIEVFVICKAFGRQYDPSISGDTVVWTDGRDASNSSIYAADISDIYNITERKVTNDSNSFIQPALYDNILTYLEGNVIKVACKVNNGSFIEIPQDEYYSGVGVQIGPAPTKGDYVLVWQDDYYGVAKGLLVKNGYYAVSDGPVDNTTSGMYFDSIGNSLLAADTGDVITVAPGVYDENLVLTGKCVTLKAASGGELAGGAETILTSNGNKPVITLDDNREGNVILDGFSFTGTNASDAKYGGAINAYFAKVDLRNCIFEGLFSMYGGAAYFDTSLFSFTNCIFSANSAFSGGSVYSVNASGEFTNCTFVNNNAYDLGGALYVTGARSVSLTNNIFYANDAVTGYDVAVAAPGASAGLEISYNNIGPDGAGVYAQDDYPVSYAGVNLDTDPLFVDFLSDLHLQSESGRWDSVNTVWVTDLQTSPCIDAGDKASCYSNELWPHGKLCNLGAYGNTPQASMSINEQAGNIADVTTDDVVNLKDFAVIQASWLESGELMHCDLDRDGSVGVDDLTAFVSNWLWNQ